MILLLTPLTVEYDALVAALGLPLTPTTVGSVHVRSGAQIAVATGGHGKVQFALTTQHLARELSPRLVICAGACGALDPALSPLDVVIATETLEHDYRLRFVKKPLPAFSGHAESLARAQALRFGFPLHLGKIASGDEDIIETERAAELRAQTGAIAVAWEGAGGARAARFQKTDFLEIRAVTDTADAHAPGQFAQNIAAGMAHVAQVIKALI